MLALADGNAGAAMPEIFRIPEIGDDALLVLFCPTSQIAPAKGSASVP